MFYKIFISVIAFWWCGFLQGYCVNPHAENLRIRASLTDYDYNSDIELEKLFRENLSSFDGIIYTIIPMGVVISMNGFLFYDEGSDKLKPCACKILDIVADLLDTAGKNCLVESTTAPNAFNSSGYDSNWELSLVRANNIENYLLKTRKVKQNKIRSNGFGEFMPFKKYQSTTQERINFIIINYEDTFR